MTKKYYLGLDVGGTKTEGAIAELKHTHEIVVLAKKRIKTSHSVPEFRDSLKDLMEALLSEASLSWENVKAIGLGLPGTLDPQTKIMINGNTQFLIGEDLRSELQKKIPAGIPLVLENDANLFTLAESWGGAGLLFSRQQQIPFLKQIAIGITLGTGVGGGLISSGALYTGAHGGGLEVGHISLDFAGLNCYCGQKGCAESYLSGTALGKKFPTTDIFQQAQVGDAEALKALASYREHLVHFLSILSNLFNPHYVVFGGGLSSQEALFCGLREELMKKTFLPEKFCPDIYINQLGDSAGVFGAMIYAKHCGL